MQSTLGRRQAETRNLASERLVRLTATQYEALVPAGILPEGAPIELLNGIMRWKDRAAAGESVTTVGKRHARTVTRLQQLLILLLQNADCFVQTQMPISLSDVDEPEPDLCVVASAIDDERERHPTPDELLLVIEVADSSLHGDQTEKLEAYAAAGVREYWIVDIVNDQIEVYQQPDQAQFLYVMRISKRPGELLEFILPDATSIELNVSQVLFGTT